MTPTISLDHVVILVPYATLLNLPLHITKHFHITPGGTHADGLTANRLIVFADGSYLEISKFSLISSSSVLWLPAFSTHSPKANLHEIADMSLRITLRGLEL